MIPMPSFKLFIPEGVDALENVLMPYSKLIVHKIPMSCAVVPSGIIHFPEKRKKKSFGDILLQQLTTLLYKMTFCIIIAHLPKPSSA